MADKVKARTGLAIGLGKGFIVTKRDVPARPSSKKGKIGRRTALIRSVVREVAGFAPYEKRVMELIKTNALKRAQKFAKKRLGTHLRGKKKKDELVEVIAKARERKD
eukprot:GILI01001799.1.p2 GENE.GILI01001799.1~~GILI01001799.1.p2  ORF type:complete len:121 (+),score=35.47 GILI01001799.1:43-363(+)